MGAVKSAGPGILQLSQQWDGLSSVPLAEDDRPPRHRSDGVAGSGSIRVRLPRCGNQVMNSECETNTSPT